MRDFFARNVDFDSGLPMFGGLHLTLCALLFIFGALIIFFRDKLRKFGHFDAVRLTFAWVLLSNMIIHYTGRTLIGEWHFSEDLPLHICFITNFFMIYILFTNNKHNLFSVVYYFTVIGPLPAVLFPDISRTGSGYLFWQFVISHHVMLLIGLYCAFVLYTPPERSRAGAVYAFVFGNLYVLVMGIFNRVFKTNYIMLSALPERLYGVFPFLKAFPAFVWLEIAGVLALVAAYSLRKSVRER